MLRWIWLLSSLLPLACNANCLRNSDCMGSSICTENQCILVVSRDAGRATTTPVTDTENPTPDAATEPGSDAGTVN